LENKHIRLTSTEMVNLWMSYMNDSMATCVIKYALKTVKDPEIIPILEYALHLSSQHIERVTEIFNHENFPIPKGFGNEDVNFDAPPLFSDTFYLIYFQNMSRVGLTAYSIALPLMARSDIYDFYHECVVSSVELNKQITKVMLQKGLFIRPPYISVPEDVDFVQEQGYLTGWFGSRRGLDGLEITNLFLSLLTNIFSKAILIGFSQVAKTNEVRDYMLRGKDIAQKHIEIFSSILTENDLPAPPTSDSEVLSSTTSPFSERLMMFHSKSLTQAGIANYGSAISVSRRRDLTVNYARLTAELGKIAEDGMNIMVKHGWAEQAPQADDRDALARQKNED
jgi:hypothetical protein